MSQNFEKGKFHWTLKALVPLLIVERDRKQINPPPTPTTSPNIPNQIFETVILFNVIDRSGNYVFQDDTLPPAELRARVVSYVLGQIRFIYRKNGRINFGGGLLSCYQML